MLIIVKKCFLVTVKLVSGPQTSICKFSQKTCWSGNRQQLMLAMKVAIVRPLIHCESIYRSYRHIGGFVKYTNIHEVTKKHVFLEISS